MRLVSKVGLLDEGLEVFLTGTTALALPGVLLLLLL
jgi:hypothetical protein